MSDPAIEAAQRAWDGRYPSANHFAPSAEEDGLAAGLIAAAREALKPVRELHVKTKNPGVCQRSDCLCSQPEWVCSCDTNHADYTPAWPCDTAKLIYSSEELS